MPWLLIGLLALPTVGLAIVGNGNPVAPLLPVLALGVLWLLWVVPLRYPLAVLTGAGLVFEVRSESYADDRWTSPLVTPGKFLFERLNAVIGVRPLTFSVFDLLLVFFAIIAIHRTLVGSTLDSPGKVRAPTELSRWALISLVGAMMSLAWGMGTGGEFRFALWQITRTLYLPVVLLLFLYALRGPQDWPLYSRMILVAACIKSGFAIYVRVRYLPEPIGSLFATTHNDSMLFATATGILLADLFVNYGRSSIVRALTLLPIYGAALWANNRRLAWVEIAAVGLMLFAVTPKNRFKVLLMRLIPVALLYVVLGWYIDAPIFKPVGMIRSTIDAKTDGSTLWREMENYNLIYTIGQAPVTGLGYGHGYHEILVLPDISGIFELYRHLPHNSLLGLCAFGGYLGFSAQWMLFSVAAFFAFCAYRDCHEREFRVAALGGVAVLVVYMVHCWGDLGLGSCTGMFLVVPVTAIVSKLAVSARSGGVQ